MPSTPQPLLRNRWALIGIPDHEAVLNVGGRVGAARGPLSFRQAFMKMRGPDPVQETLVDLGDVAPLGGDVEKNHELATVKVTQAHDEYPLSVVVGGGHDHGFSHLRGLLGAAAKRAPTARKPRLGCINLDAHFDVRKPNPKITSGSPFYLAIESGVLDPRGLIQFGIQRHCNATELWDYIAQKKIETIQFETLRGGKAVAAFAKALKKLTSQCDAIAISLDLDCAAQAYAPGVSAPQAEGFTPSEIIEMMEIAGREKKVISLGIFELNPEHDIDMRTARLGATSAYHFIAAALSTDQVKRPGGTLLRR